MGTTEQQDQQDPQVEAPMETARQAILTAADLEGPAWADVMRRFASSLPPRTVEDITLEEHDAVLRAWDLAGRRHGGKGSPEEG